MEIVVGVLSAVVGFPFLSLSLFSVNPWFTRLLYFIAAVEVTTLVRVWVEGGFSTALAGPLSVALAYIVMRVMLGKTEAQKEYDAKRRPRGGKAK